MVNVIYVAGTPAEHVDAIDIRGFKALVASGSILEYYFYRFFHMSPFPTPDGSIEANYSGLTRYSTPEIPYGLLIASKSARLNELGIDEHDDSNHRLVKDLQACRARLEQAREKHADFKAWVQLEWLARNQRGTMTPVDEVMWRNLGDKHGLRCRGAVNDNGGQ